MEMETSETRKSLESMRIIHADTVTTSESIWSSDIEHVIYLCNALFMYLNFFILFFSSFRLIPQKRIFHYLLSHISIISSLSYILLCNNILTFEFHGRRLYNARYFDWLLNTPVQLILLGKIGNITAANQYVLVMLDVVMILTGWFAEMTSEIVAKCVLFIMGMTTILPIYVFIFVDFDYGIVRRFSDAYIADRYYWIGRYLLSVWAIYPIIWILDTIFQKMSRLSVCMAYTILDFFSKVVFPWWILHCVRYSRVFSSGCADAVVPTVDDQKLENDSKYPDESFNNNGLKTFSESL